MLSPVRGRKRPYLEDYEAPATYSPAEQSASESTPTNPSAPSSLLSPIASLKNFLWSPSSSKAAEDHSSGRRSRRKEGFISSSPQKKTPGSGPSVPLKKARLFQNRSEEKENHDSQRTSTPTASPSFVTLTPSRHGGASPALSPLHGPQAQVVQPSILKKRSSIFTLFSPLFTFLSNKTSQPEKRASTPVSLTVRESKPSFRRVSLGSIDCTPVSLTVTRTTVTPPRRLSLLDVREAEILRDATEVFQSETEEVSTTTVVDCTSSSTNIVYSEIVSEEDEMEEVLNDEVEEEQEEGEGEGGVPFDPYLFIATLANVTPPPREPVLPPKTSDAPRITLVLDLDETLVHCSNEAMVKPEFVFPVMYKDQEYKVYARRRPYFEEFLSRVNKKFEIVIFTASEAVYARTLLDLVNTENKYIKHRLYRDSCVQVEGNYLKDLSILGRDLSQVIIVDNSPQAFGFQLDNGIPIESWFDDDGDKELLKLAHFLESLDDSSDVRPVVKNTFRVYEEVERVRSLLEEKRREMCTENAMAED